MRRTARPWLLSFALAAALGALFAGARADAQRRPPSQLTCPHVAPDGAPCARYGRGRACRYGGAAICICRRQSARDRVLRWYCGEMGE